jgi:hypothetical protein
MQGHSETPPRCLRCKTVELIPLDSPSDIAFFECPGCHRQFARDEKGSLHFRWGHPITLLLYAVIFDEHPAEHCESAANTFIKTQSADYLQLAVQEIRLELNDPTQQLRDTVKCSASEPELRAFLACVAARIEAACNSG